MGSVIEKLSNRLENDSRVNVPEVPSFRRFLLDHAKVKISGGRYIQYHLRGREALGEIIDTFDLVLGNRDGAMTFYVQGPDGVEDIKVEGCLGKPLADSILDVCGGAQIGKTILALNFGAYLTACRFLNWGYYLPDDDLVQGVVDAKLRPDVVDQIEWLPELMSIGKTEDGAGRKLDRKGAFMVSDGVRKAFAMIRGMGKIPTTFSMDVAMEDEKDDIPAKRSKYVTGRMTGSEYRIRSSIGTQRLHGAGQNKQFVDGSQGVRMFPVPGSDRWINLEENWPECCRLQMGEKPQSSDPKLTLTATFKGANGVDIAYQPGQTFYYADPETGAVINRVSSGRWVHRRGDRIKLRKISWRVSQLIFDAMPVAQAVSRWQEAVKDPEMMTVFKCDVLATPANTAQAITPEVVKRSQNVDEPYDLGLTLSPRARGFAGMDTGNQCWFFAREVQSEKIKRARWAEKIPLGDAVRRAEILFHKLGLGALFIDARPAVNEARTLCYKLNNLEGISWPQVDDPQNAYISFPGGLIWDGKRKRFENLRCAVVEFTKKSGGGIEQKLGVDPRPGETFYFPIIQCNRYETIDRVVNEFLTPAENVVKVVDGELLDEPVMRLPQRVPGSPAIVETLESHLITGSQREDNDGEAGEYVDKCENHLLLADGYSALAEMIAVGESAVPFGYQPLPDVNPRNFRRRGGLGSARRGGVKL